MLRLPSPRRQRRLSILLVAPLWLAACVDPDVSAPLPGPPTAAGDPTAPGAPGTPLPQPGSPPPPGGHASARGVRVAANILDVTDTSLHVLGPEGEGVIRLAPHALDAFRPERGDTVTLECSVTPDGALLARSIAPHTGLGLYYGTVAALSSTSLTVHSPLGDEAFTVNPWSDLPVALAVGEFVSVKHYTFDGGRAVLNARRFPGWVEEQGEITAMDSAGPTAGALSTRTLGGPRRYPTSPGQVTGLKPGDLVLVRYHRGADSPFVDLTLTPREAPLAFIGKMSAYDAGTRTFSMVDAWSDVLGIVAFRVPSPPPATIVPGDLVDVRYAWSTDTLPVISTLEERTLSPVFFGRIQELDDTHIALTTLQGQPKRLTVTPDTWRPGPVQVGDMADVVWKADPAGGQPHAEVIVRE